MTTLQKRLARLQQELEDTPPEYQDEIRLSIRKVEAVLEARLAKRQAIPDLDIPEYEDLFAQASAL